MTELEEKKTELSQLEKDLKNKDGEIAQLRKNVNKGPTKGPSKCRLCIYFTLSVLAFLIIGVIVFIFATNENTRYHVFKFWGMIKDNEEKPL